MSAKRGVLESCTFPATLRVYLLPYLFASLLYVQGIPMHNDMFVCFIFLACCHHTRLLNSSQPALPSLRVVKAEP